MAVGTPSSLSRESPLRPETRHGLSPGSEQRPKPQRPEWRSRICRVTAATRGRGSSQSQKPDGLLGLSHESSQVPATGMTGRPAHGRLSMRSQFKMRGRASPLSIRSGLSAQRCPMSRLHRSSSTRQARLPLGSGLDSQPSRWGCHKIDRKSAPPRDSRRAIAGFNMRLSRQSAIRSWIR